jgi:hypothetical protein
MTEDVKELLKQELAQLSKASDILAHFYQNCKSIGAKETYSVEELDKLEALTSRFARLSDMLIQKALRLIDKIELEDEGSVRDRINRAEKRKAIDNAERLTEIRVLRNNISHNYLPEELIVIYKKVLELTPILLNDCNRVVEYCGKYFK